MSVGLYDTARVRLNGHVVTSMSKSSPPHTRKSCEECGAKTMGECPKCYFAIPVRYCLSHANRVVPYDFPSHCGNCGDAHPWTMRSIQALALAVQGFEGLGSDDATKFQDNAAGIVNDIPMIKCASARLKSIIVKTSTAPSKIKDMLPKMLARKQNISCSNEVGGAPVHVFGVAFSIFCCIKCTRPRGGAAPLGTGSCAPGQICGAFGPNAAPRLLAAAPEEPMPSLPPRAARLDAGEEGLQTGPLRPLFPAAPRGAGRILARMLAGHGHRRAAGRASRFCALRRAPPSSRIAPGAAMDQTAQLLFERSSVCHTVMAADRLAVSKELQGGVDDAGRKYAISFGRIGPLVIPFPPAKTWRARSVGRRPAGGTLS